MIQTTLLIFLCLLSSWSVAQDVAPENSHSITWMHADFPPLRIIDGPFAGQGPSDMIHELMAKELPGYRQRVVTANLARTLDEIKNGRQVLAVGLFATPERERIALFSLPCVLSPPVALIIRQEDAAKWPQALPLGDFLERGRLGISRSRSYGPAMDAVLHDFRNHDNLFVDSSDRLFENLLKMLLLNRIDGVLGFPFEAMYNAKTTGVTDQVAVVPIAEGGDYLMGRIAAPRTDWGAAMIYRINKILLRQRPQPSYRASFLLWLPPSIHADFNRLYDSQFLTQK